MTESNAQRLERFRDLTENWDGYGGRAISAAAIEKAHSLLLIDNTSFVAPGSDGGVGFEWSLESGKELLLEISPEGNMTYLLIERLPDGSEIETEGALQDGEKLRTLLAGVVEPRRCNVSNERCCEHPRAEHGQERAFYECDDSRREVCLMCPGYEEPGYPNGQAWHRFREVP